MFRYLRKPGLPIDEQLELNRYDLEQKPFEELEREIRTELEHVLGPWGFEAAKDIKAITVNRWGHGYIVFPHPDVESPHRYRGRERIGRISFAGADASGSPWTQGAFREAHRAVHEQLAL
jgi:spermidine dehydrogenase